MTEKTEVSFPLSQIIIAGTAMAVGAVLIFGLLWFGLGQLGVRDVVRLALAVCVPPLLLMIASIGLYLRRRSV